MPVPELVLQYFEVLAWPLVTATALVVFRDSLSGLVYRVRSVSAFGASAELAAEERREKADLQAALTEGAAVLGAAEGSEADVAADKVFAALGQDAQPPVADDEVPEAGSPDSDDGQSESGLNRLREEVEGRRSKQAETRVGAMRSRRSSARLPSGVTPAAQPGWTFRARTSCGTVTCRG